MNIIVKFNLKDNKAILDFSGDERDSNSYDYGQRGVMASTKACGAFSPGSNPGTGPSNDISREELIVLVPKNSGLKDAQKKTLAMIKGDNKRILELRGEDIPQLCEEFSKNGKRVIGLTGEDLYWEYILKKKKKTNVRLLKKIEWNDPKAKFRKPVLCLLGPKDKNLKDLPKNLRIILSAKYINISKRYLNLMENELGYNFSKIYTRGMSEEGFSEGIADLVIEIVYSGVSIEKYGLRIYDTIFESDFVVIGTKECEGSV